MGRTEIAILANQAARLSRRDGAPIMSATSSRLRVVAWLQWNDNSGSHIDGLAAIDGVDPYTTDRAWTALAEMARVGATFVGRRLLSGGA